MRLFLLGKYFVLKSTEISERSVSSEGVECVYHTISAIGTSLGRSLIAQNTYLNTFNTLSVRKYVISAISRHLVV